MSSCCSTPLVVNQNVIQMEYAVRGKIPQRAAALKKEGRRIIPCNIGNPQALGQKPISYYRQVLSLVEDSSRIARERKLNAVLQQSELAAEFQENELLSKYVLDVSEMILTKMETGTGAYTESPGPAFIREAIAAFIDKRDEVADSGGVPANPDTIFLTNGASDAVKFLLEMLIADPNDGIMIPIPQYPLYSATLKKYGGVQVNYYPDEDHDWSLERSMLEESIAEAKKKGVNVKAIVVINPANPTGAVQDRKSVEEVIAFAKDHELAIIADEVYQENTYGLEFFSFANVLGSAPVPLFSLNSVSKGFFGECGHRGGYLEVRNAPNLQGTDKNFLDVLLKQASVNLCSNTAGQILTYLTVTPPEPGSEPYEQFIQEKEAILDALHEKAMIIKEAFTKMDGVKCFGRVGALYLFPRLEKLPAGATDFDYCMALLEKTGLCTVNGSGFGQREGTNHLRIAFLPPKEMLEEVLPQWIEFHHNYVKGA